VQAEAVRYYNGISGEYDRMLVADWRIRKAFHQLVLSRVPRGSLIFDFGCGTGIDAAVYADRGYRVLAWDPSRTMREQASLRCERHVRAGRVTVLSSYGPDVVRSIPKAITANFAVASLIPNLQSQFQDWARYLDRSGWLLLSIQNPWFLLDMKQRWWWRGLPRLLTRGEFRVSDSHLYRRRSLFVSRIAKPYFEEKSRTSNPFAKFSFLVYERCPA
jgi:SAM-dependent methyltransferase